MGILRKGIRLKYWKSYLFVVIFVLLLPYPVWTKAKTPEGSSPPSSLYKQLDLFTRVINLIREDYVEEANEKEMIYGAIRGMLATLDPHSVFMPPDIYKELKVDTEGRFGGVGLEVTLKDNILTVVTPIEGTPAQKSGLREGDRILKIDGISTKELGLTEAVRKMRGPRGSRVHLVLIREGAKEPFEVTLVRDIIRIKSVRYEMPEEGFAYVRITSFQEKTSEELSRAIEALKRKTKDGLKGLILDLRNNPGGFLEVSQEIAGWFVNPGDVVVIEDFGDERQNREYRAIGNGALRDFKVVAIINGGSASAAEIMAGALRDLKGVTLVGAKSFGKGSIQELTNLKAGSSLKVTIARWLTPSGVSISEKGIEPDVKVELTEEDRLADRDPQFERALEIIRSQ